MTEEKELTELEKEFSDLVKVAKDQIEAKLKEARYAIQEAQNISERYGVPFYANVSPLSQSYFPKTYYAKFSELDSDFVVDLTDAYDKWGETYGWMHSSVC
jgi:hypothetical protein